MNEMSEVTKILLGLLVLAGIIALFALIWITMPGGFDTYQPDPAFAARMEECRQAFYLPESCR